MYQGPHIQIPFSNIDYIKKDHDSIGTVVLKSGIRINLESVAETAEITGQLEDWLKKGVI